VQTANSLETEPDAAPAPAASISDPHVKKVLDVFKGRVRSEG